MTTTGTSFNPSRTASHRRQRGLTLLELVVVVALLVVLAGFIIPLAAGQIDKARTTATNANLVLIRDAIMGTSDKPGYYSDTGQFPRTLKDLFINPFASTDPLAMFNRDTGRGWHGPYLIPTGSTYPNNFANTYIANDPAILDAWGQPIVIQIPDPAQIGPGTYPNSKTASQAFIRLISAGPNGVVDTPQNGVDASGNPYPAPANRGDDLVLFINHSDSDP